MTATGSGEEGRSAVPDAGLVDRLAGLPRVGELPREELEWLVAHGRFETYEAGQILAPMGKRIEHLWVILSGRVTVWVDRGAGPRQVITWRPGDVSGMLPYSRMKGPPGDNYPEERSEILAVHESHFPEMVCRCPELTAYTVHLMLDRARSFNASDLHDEKMISLGRLAAGLAHELNNPASAAVRGAKVLRSGLIAADGALRALAGSGLSARQIEAVERIRSSCLLEAGDDLLSPIQRADREDEILDWLARNGSDPSLAEPLADTAITLDALDALRELASDETLHAALEWIAAGCSTHAVAADIESAAIRIEELVAAVKRFTYMDRLAAPETVDVQPGLVDTLRVLASKSKSKQAAISMDVEPGLPPVHAVGGELNQVWLNLIDNALDAIPEGGRIDISARRELDRVVVRVVDDGPGIPPDVLPQIFDPFFTTKPPGHGTGLGLEITQRLLRSRGGDIAVDSRPGRTEFRVSLPVDEERERPPETPEPT